MGYLSPRGDRGVCFDGCCSWLSWPPESKRGEEKASKMCSSSSLSVQWVGLRLLRDFQWWPVWVLSNTDLLICSNTCCTIFENLPRRRYSYPPNYLAPDSFQVNWVIFAAKLFEIKTTAVQECAIIKSWASAVSTIWWHIFIWLTFAVELIESRKPGIINQSWRKSNYKKLGAGCYFYPSHFYCLGRSTASTRWTDMYGRTNSNGLTP